MNDALRTIGVMTMVTVACYAILTTSLLTDLFGWGFIALFVGAFAVGMWQQHLAPLLRRLSR